MIKRLFITVALAVISLTSTTALAVVGTAHDFSELGGNPCAYCHSIHNTLGGLGRPSYAGDLPTILKVYSSATMDHKPTIAVAMDSDAPLCLTCHDETTITDRATAGGGSAMAEKIRVKIAGTTRNIGNGVGASDTMDLSNDHPVGFVFNDLLDPMIKAPGADLSVSFGLLSNEMWCSTCHNVHGGVAGTKFLNTSNAGSALCLSCHIK